MGRRPSPTALKVINGSAEHDPGRLNSSEPMPPTLIPGTKPPGWLRGQRRRRAWADLVTLLTEQRLLTVMDQAALAVLIDAYGDYLEAGDLIAGMACGHCGLPVRSRVRCSAPSRYELDAEGGRQVVPAEHAPGRRYYTTVTEKGSLMIRPHPAMAIRSDAWKRVVGMLDRFGMNPAARARVSAAAGGEEDPFETLLARRGNGSR